MQPRSGPSVVVVGAGIAGLSAAFRLQQAGCEVSVLERSGPERVGGRMASVERGGFHIDLGAPLLANRYRRMRQLIAEIDIGDQVLPSRGVLGVLRDGAVLRGRTGTVSRMMRSGILSAAGPVHRLRLVRDMARLRRYVDTVDMSAAATLAPESVTEYARRRGFPREVVDYVLDPLNSITCLDDPEDTPALGALLMLIFFARGDGLFTSSVGSGFLPQRLGALVPVTFRADVTSVEEAPREVVVTWRTADGNERQTRADAAVIAIPADELPKVFAQLSPEQRAYFHSAEYVPLVQVTFCLARATRETSAVLCSGRTDLPDIALLVLQHNLSPRRVPDGCGMVTAYLRGSASRSLWDADDTRIIDQVIADTAKLGVLPELERDGTACHVDRIWPSVRTRRPDDYRGLAKAAALTRATDKRVHLAGGDLFSHSTTIGSLTSGEQSAGRILARFA